MRLIRRIAHQIADDLRGTCNGYPNEENLVDALLNMGKISSATHKNPSQQKLEKIYRQREDSLLQCVYEDLFLCDCCGWWYETHEQAENIVSANVCNNCGDDYCE